MKTKIFALVCILLSGGCNTYKPLDNKSDLKDQAVSNDYFVNAAIYNYFTAEYKALAYQAFNSASAQIELLRLKNPKRTDMAIVLDIDETLLDNSPYQAKLFEMHASYDSLWNDWCNLKAARPVPGSLEFLNLADSLGFNIFYITNRKLKTVFEGTLENLKIAGFPQSDSTHLIMRTDTNSKEKRRQEVEKNYEIIMFVGDNIGDFYEDTDDFTEREKVLNSHRIEFGRKLIVLPNAMYGNWVNSLGIKTNRDVDSLISIMVLPFNK